MVPCSFVPSTEKTWYPGVSLPAVNRAGAVVTVPSCLACFMILGGFLLRLALEGEPQDRDC